MRSLPGRAHRQWEDMQPPWVIECACKCAGCGAIGGRRLLVAGARRSTVHRLAILRRSTRGPLNLKTAPRFFRTFAAFADGNPHNLADEAFHGETHAPMLSGQHGQRTARAVDPNLAVGFHARERSEMFIHQLAGFEDARPETTSGPFSSSQVMSEPLAGFSKQRLELIG